MTIEETFKAILDSLPLKPSRSRLEPYAKFIMELYRRGRTYREIARILSEHCGIQTSRSTVNDWVRARLKRSRNLQKRKLLEPKTRNHNDASSPENDLPPETEIAANEVQKRIAELKRKPIPAAANLQLFHYDPNKPLNLPLKKKADA